MEYNKCKYDCLNYKVQKDFILFTCNSIDEKYKNNAAAHLINDLLLEFSKEHFVFYTAYRLQKNVNVSDLIVPDVVLGRATGLIEPFYTCFHLSEAKIDLTKNEKCVIYFFEKEVEWPDFLVSFRSGDKKVRSLMKSGKLCALFEIYGSEYLFKCGKAYEGRLRLFFEDMANAGYDVSRGRNKSHLLWIRESYRRRGIL